MAGAKEYPAPVGTRAVERFLRRWYALAGGSVALDIGGTIQPSVEMRPVLPWEFRDWGVIPWVSRSDIGLVAGEHTYVEVGQIPSAEPYDIVVTSIRPSGACSVRLMPATIGDVAATGAFSRDNGMVPFAVGLTQVAFITSATAVIGAFTNAVGTIAAGAEWELPIIIRKGITGVLVVNHDTIATALVVTLAGFLVPQNMSLT